MKKLKLLTASVAIAMGVTFVGALAACKSGPSDAETAEQAITFVRSLYYNDNGKETSGPYEVIGQVKTNDKFYKVDWTVSPAESCTLENFGDYVSVGDFNEDDGTVTINVSKATVKIDYTLKASVTVGKANQSVEFTHYVSASLATEPDETDATISFTNQETMKSMTADQQIWQQGDITLTNDKGKSGTAVNNATSKYHIRLYKDSSVKIEFPGMFKLVFHSEAAFTDDKGKTSDYPGYLKSSLEAANLGGTVTASQAEINEKTVDLVTLELAKPTDILEFTASGGQIRLTSLDIIAKKGGTSDADKVASALAQITLSQTNYTATDSYDLPANKGGLNVSWSLEAASDYATVENGKLIVTSMPESEVEIKLVASVTSGSVTDTKTFTVKLVKLELENDGSAAHPYTVAEAKQVARLLNAGTTTGDEYYVTGYVIVAGTYNSQYNNFDGMYIADSATSTQESDDAFQVYRPKTDATYLTASGFTVGDLVVFKGKLKNHQHSSGELELEIDTGATCVARTTAADLNKDDQEKVNTAKENVASTLKATYNNGATVTLLSTLNGASLVWAVKSGANVTITNNEMTIGDEATGTVTLTVTISSGNVSDDTTELSFTVEAMKGGSVDNPLSVAEAKEIASKLASDGYYSQNGTAQLVYVQGYVIATGTYNSTYNNYEGVYIVDEFSADKTTSDGIQCYRLMLGTGITAFYKGDRITVYGYIQNYKGNTKQVTYNGSTNPQLVALTPATDAAKVEIALAAISATLPNVTEAQDVTLNTTSTVDGVTLAWSTENETYTVENGNTLKVSALPTENNATVILKVTATSGSVSDDKEVRVIINKQASPDDPEPEKATLTLTATGTNGLGLTSKYSDGSKTVSNIGMAWKQLYYQSAGIQMRTSSGVSSSLWNTTALGTKITSLTLVWAASQNISKTNALKIEFANNAEFTDAIKVDVSFADGNKTQEVTIPGGEYTYVRITHNASNAIYLDTITIGYEIAPATASTASLNSVEALVDEKKY